MGPSASGCPAVAKSQRLKRNGSVSASLNDFAVAPAAPLQMTTASLSTPSASFSGKGCCCPDSGRFRSSTSSLWKNPTPAAGSAGLFALGNYKLSDSVEAFMEVFHNRTK